MALDLELLFPYMRFVCTQQSRHDMLYPVHGLMLLLKNFLGVNSSSEVFDCLTHARPSPGAPTKPKLGPPPQFKSRPRAGAWAQTLARALEVDAPRNLALLHPRPPQAKCRTACVMVLTLVAPLDFLRFPLKTPFQ